MFEAKWLVVSVAVSCCLFEACSSKPGTVENGGENPPVAKPKFDFGNVAISPNSGKGNEATFHLGVSGGSQKPTLLGLLINSNQDGGHACYVMHNFANNTTILVADAGTGTVSPEGQKPLANHQCEVVRDGTTSSVDAAGVNVTFHILFSPGFGGAKHMWSVPEDATANGPGMVLLGDWTVQ
jgi:hypothetical protein